MPLASAMNLIDTSTKSEEKMAKIAPALTSNILDSFWGEPIQKSIYFKPVSENEVEGVISMSIQTKRKL